MQSALEALAIRIRACRVCEAFLPLGPRPIFSIDPRARILIIGQAPGAKVNASGVPWADASGRRLREWLAVTEDEFYDPARISLVPMGFCYPGAGGSGDLPPRPECAPLWHPQILPSLVELRLTIFIGRYALGRYLPEFEAVTDAVRAYERLLPGRFAMPHPSPRNRAWLAQNSWFLDVAVPRLRTVVREALA
jgi:uracil-DNA glycosylase